MIGTYRRLNIETLRRRLIMKLMNVGYRRRFKVLGLTLNEWLILMLISLPTSWFVANEFYIPTILPYLV